VTEQPTVSLTNFAVALVAVSVGAVAGLTLVPVVGTYVGVLVGGLVTGVAVEDRSLVETGVAAVLANLGILAAGPVIGAGFGATISLFGVLSPIALLTTVVLSFCVGAFGGHFGDDLRDGLTEPVESKSGDADTSIAAPVEEPTNSEETESRHREVETEGTDTATGRPDDSSARSSARDESAQTASEELELERE
jgi:hypothetical protein